METASRSRLSNASRRLRAPRLAFTLVSLAAAFTSGCAGSDEVTSGEVDVGGAELGVGPFRRSAEVHLYEDELWQLPLDRPAGQPDPSRIVGDLAIFAPTYVTGLVKIEPPDFFEQHAAPSDDTVSEMKGVFHEVRSAFPDALFDVWLSGRRYAAFEGAGGLRHMLESVHEHFEPQAIFFDFLHCNEKKGSSDASCETKQDVMKQAIDWCHHHGILIGGNFFGMPLAGDATLGADFLALSDSQDDASGDFGPGTSADAKLRAQIDALKQLAPHARLVLHLNNNPQNSFHGIAPWNQRPLAEKRYAFPTPSCMFGNPEARASTGRESWWDAGQRAKYLEARTEHQDDWGYRFIYDVIGSSCVPTRAVAGVGAGEPEDNWASACGCTKKPGDHASDLPSACHAHFAAPGECLTHQVWYEARRDAFGKGKTMLDHMASLADL